MPKLHPIESYQIQVLSRGLFSPKAVLEERDRRKTNNMGRAPCCDKANVKKGPWSPEEDDKLREYIHKHGTAGNWIALPQKLGLRRCGKSCRLRWLNYLRPNIKHGEFSDDEDRIICTLFASIGSRWSIMAAQLPGRTDNDIKNYWNTKLKKKLMGVTRNYNITPVRSTQYQGSPHRLAVCPAPPNKSSSSSSHFAPADFTSPGAIGFSGPTREDNLLVFGGDRRDQDLCYFGNEINDQKFSFGSSSSSWTAEIDGCGLTEYPMDYGIEEIKQLIGTSNTCSFFADETAELEL